MRFIEIAGSEQPIFDKCYLVVHLLYVLSMHKHFTRLSDGIDVSPRCVLKLYLMVSLVNPWSPCAKCASSITVPTLSRMLCAVRI